MIERVALRDDAVMIRALRSRHRTVIVLLSVVLPLLVVAGLLARRSQPPGHSSSTGWPDAARSGSEEPTGRRLVAWEGGSLAASLVERGSTADAGAAVRLEPLAEIARPELLVYWSPRPGDGDDALPEDAYLLGALDGTHPVELPLPAASTRTDGKLIFYSLGQHEIVTRLDFPTAGGPGTAP